MMNLKSEIRISKLEINTNDQNQNDQILAVWNFEHSNFKFVSDFVLRNSNLTRISKSKISCVSGLTLTELLITTVIVGVMMLGIVGAQMALQQSERGATRQALVSMRLSAMMTDISKNASLAIGNSFQPGIVINRTGFCFRQDRGAPLGTPADFTDDKWVCYTRIGTNLYKCESNLSSRCEGEGEDQILGAVTTRTFTEFATPPTTTLPRLVIDETVSNQKMFFEFTLETRYDPSKPYDYLNNPQLQMTTRVVPEGYSF